MKNRREFLRCAPIAAAWGSIQASEQAFGFQGEKSKLKITGLRLVNTRPKRVLYTRPLDRPGFGWDVIADPI